MEHCIVVARVRLTAIVERPCGSSSFVVVPILARALLGVSRLDVPFCGNTVLIN